MAKEVSRPNILYIMADDHAKEAIGAYGSWLKDYVRTPAIDQLAAEGMRFNNVCVNNSICSPSRASILTGQYNHKNGVINLGGMINPTSPMFTEELKKAGYQTAVFGKWHLSGPMRGFDMWAVTPTQGSYFNPKLETPDGPKKMEGYYTESLAKFSLDWLRQRDKSKPFLLCVHFKGPHDPFDYPDSYAKLLDGVTVPEPPTIHEDVEKTSPMLKALLDQQLARNRNYYQTHKNDKNPPMGPAGKDRASQASAAYQHLIHRYIRCVAALDDTVKVIVDELKAENVLDDTVVVYTSDQGYFLGQHGLFDKRLMLEEALKMPLIVRYPKLVKAGSVNDHMCSNVDFAPTFIELAGGAIPSSMQGRSLLPLLRGESPSDWRKSIWYAYWAGPSHYGIRNDRGETLVCFPNTDKIEFYDSAKDPLQQVSLDGNPEYAPRIAEAKKTLTQMIKEVDIPESMLTSKPKNQKPAKGGER